MMLSSVQVQVQVLFCLTLATGALASALPSRHPITSSSEAPLPLVIWHGLGDNYQADGLLAVGDLAQEIYPNTFVYNIRLDSDPGSDRTATFFGNVTLQVDQVCSDLASNPILSRAPAINALGFSQGGQFLRAYIERCNSPPVRTLVTFGSQHNGIRDFRSCGATDFVCRGALGLLKSNTWSDFVQSRVVPAQYYRDADDLETYLEHSNFLADINNERNSKNTTYKKNLSTLERFVMFAFSEDTTVIPKETAWFAEVNATTGKVTPLRERDIYGEDWLGLKALDKEGRLEFLTAKGDHMELSESLLNETFRRYFGPTGKEVMLQDEQYRLQEQL
ncbi:MAG: hypothetical protein M1819_000520 [Sarea resinae]|nr:MAG: hypothetical protein M1819_000520 [Sarea resinae]